MFCKLRPSASLWKAYSPDASRYWNERAFKASIDRHLLKANDYTAIDLTTFTDAQKAIVRAYVDAMPAATRARIVRIGF